ncbi:MAG TPA: chemotaxis protein CheW [Fimbriimonadaceae bacterium]|nr:chemotaxis protein CheW [Fimbriimonadaceae bacterium]
MSEGKYVVFKLDSDCYGLPIERVERILPEQPLTDVPRTPTMLLGVFDLRGDRIPTLDMRRRLEMPSSPDASEFVVVMTDAGRCALRVDHVDGILVLTDDDIEADSAAFLGPTGGFVAGMGWSGDHRIVLLDVDTLIPKTLRRAVAQAA